MVFPEISAFVDRFYELSDDGSKHSEYADQFSYPSASSSSPGTAFFFQIGPMAPASTREGVLAWRNKAWESVARRKHTIHDVYVLPAGKGDMDAKAKDGSVPGELMLYGRVDYEKKDGAKAAATKQIKAKNVWSMVLVAIIPNSSRACGKRNMSSCDSDKRSMLDSVARSGQ